jgi:hypothetical protein
MHINAPSTTVCDAMLEPDTRKVLVAQRPDAVGDTPDEFAQLYNAEITCWSKVVKEIDLQPNW